MRWYMLKTEAIISPSLSSLAWTWRGAVSWKRAECR